MNSKTEKFYEFMGPVFGSREVQRTTGDRFYDDPDKTWWIYINDKQVVAVLSVKGSEIKNVYGEREYLAILLKEVYPFVSSGIVPCIYREIYDSTGYKVSEKSSNYVNIKGAYIREK